MMFTYNCQICGQKIDMEKKDPQSALQHHLWGGHRMDVIRSHEIADKLYNKTISEQELLELKQMTLPEIGRLL